MMYSMLVRKGRHIRYMGQRKGISGGETTQPKSCYTDILCLRSLHHLSVTLRLNGVNLVGSNLDFYDTLLLFFCVLSENFRLVDCQALPVTESLGILHFVKSWMK